MATSRSCYSSVCLSVCVCQSLCKSLCLSLYAYSGTDQVNEVAASKAIRLLSQVIFYRGRQLLTAECFHCNHIHYIIYPPLPNPTLAINTAASVCAHNITFAILRSQHCTHSTQTHHEHSHLTCCLESGCFVPTCE